MAMRTIKKIIIRWNHQSAMFFWDPFVALKLKFGKVKVPIVYPDCPWSNPVFCVQQVLIFARCFFLFVSWLDHIKYVKSRFSWLNIPSFLLGEQSQHFCHQNHRCLFKGDPTRWHRGWWPRSEGGSTMKCSLKRCLITINKGNIILGCFPLKLISSTHIRNL